MVDIYFLVHTGEANYNGENTIWFKSASVNGIVWANRETVSVFCFALNYSVVSSKLQLNIIICLIRFYLQIEPAFGEAVAILMSPINKCIYTACWSDGMIIFLKTCKFSRLF